MLYRLFTEDVPEHRDAVFAEVGKYYDGFTVLYAQGYWKGQPENSLVIEIVTDGEHHQSKIMQLANGIKQVNRQESVLVQRIECHNWFV